MKDRQCVGDDFIVKVEQFWESTGNCSRSMYHGYYLAPGINWQEYYLAMATSCHGNSYELTRV